MELRKQLEERVADTNEKCFICGIEKNTFNRTLDRDAFRTHIGKDQNLWNYIYFIIYIWEQDKDDDDGLESYVRKCVTEQDLIWFPMNKAIRLAEHHDKGDVNSLKYRFRKDLNKTEGQVHGKLQFFKDQLNRTIGRVEKALEFEQEAETGLKSRRMATARMARSVSNGGFGLPVTPVATPLEGTRPTKLGRLNSFSAGGGNRPHSDSFASADDKSPAQGRSRASSSADFFSNAALNSALTASADMAPRTTRMNSSANLNSFNAMDADTKNQMHLRVVSISGLNVRRENLGQISVKVSSEFAQCSVRPMADVEQDLSTFLKKEGEGSRGNDRNASPNAKQRGLGPARASFSQSAGAGAVAPMSLRDSFSTGNGGSNLEKGFLRFDVLSNPSLLVHEGPLPMVDISKIVVKVQVLLHLGQGRDSSSLCIAAVEIPFVSLVTKAEKGGVLEVAFEQRAYEIPEQHHVSSSAATGDLRVTDVEDDPHTAVGELGGKAVYMNESPFCVITVSAIASHKLLRDWSMANK